MIRQVGQLIGNNKKLGGMMLVLSFAAMACVAGQPGGHLNDPAGIGSGPGGKNVAPDEGGGLNDADPAEPEKAPCPPESKKYKNYAPAGGNSAQLTFNCADGSIGSTTVQPGHSVVFDEGCASCGPKCQCIDCGITSLSVDGEARWSCEMQNAYFDAYGIDLAAIDDYTVADSDLDRPKRIYDVDGHLVRLRYFAVPVIDEDGEFVEWELTTVKPHFSVKDSEVVIRDKFKRVIGDRTGITLEK